MAHCEKKDEAPAPYSVVPLFRVPIYRQKWIEHDDGSFSNSLALSHSHRPATTHSLVFDLGLVVIISVLTQRFHEGHGKGGQGATAVIWSVHDVALHFLPIFHRWRTTQRFLNYFDQNDIVFLAFWIVEVALLVVAGNTSTCATDTLCRHGCTISAIAMALWSTAQLAMTIYGVVANSWAPCVRLAVRHGGAVVAKRTLAPRYRRRHCVLNTSFEAAYHAPSIALFALAAVLQGPEMGAAQCSTFTAAHERGFTWPAVAVLWLAMAWEWIGCPLLFVFLHCCVLTQRCALNNNNSEGALDGVTGAPDDKDERGGSNEERETRATSATCSASASASGVIRPKHLFFPQDIDLTVERYGLLCVLVLGEFFVAATKTLVASEHGAEHPPAGNATGSASGGAATLVCFGGDPNIFGAAVTVVAILALKMLYFELSDAIRPSSSETKKVDGPRHALQRGIVQAFVWMLLHAPLFIAMVAMTTVFESYVEGSCIADELVVLLSSATGVVILALTTMGLMHSSGDPRARARRGCLTKQIRTTARVLFAGAAFATSFLVAWDTTSDAAATARAHLAAGANTLILASVVVVESIGRCPVEVSPAERAAYAACAAEKAEKARAARESPHLRAPAESFSVIGFLFDRRRREVAVRAVGRRSAGASSAELDAPLIQDS